MRMTVTTTGVVWAAKLPQEYRNCERHEKSLIWPSDKGYRRLSPQFSEKMRNMKVLPVQPSGNTQQGETKHGGPDNVLRQPLIVTSFNFMQCNFYS